MPSPKRWFPVSHDIFDDPELWAFIERFGTRAILTPFYIFSQIDRKENHLPLAGDWLRSTARRLRQTPKSIAEQLVWLLANDWLSTGGYAADHWRIHGQALAGTWLDTGEILADNLPMILSARNYWKFHKRRETSGNHKETSKAPPYPIRSDPNRSEPLKEKKETPDPLYPPELKTTNGHHAAPLILPEGFEEFWIAYPNKTGKQAAVRAWRKAKHKPPLEQILSSITSAKQSKKWTDENGRFIPNPATWLNEGRWDDKPVEALVANGNGHAMKPPPFPGRHDPIARNAWRLAYGDPKQYGYS